MQGACAGWLCAPRLQGVPAGRNARLKAGGCALVYPAQCLNILRGWKRLIVANALQSHAEQSPAGVRKCAFALPLAGTGVTCPCFDSIVLHFVPAAGALYPTYCKSASAPVSC